MGKKQTNENMDAQIPAGEACAEDCDCTDNACACGNCGGYDDCGGCGSYQGSSPSFGVRVLKGIMMLAATVFLVLLTVCLWQQVSGNGWFKNIKAEITDQPFARTVTVTGDGKVTVKPDLAQVSLSVVSTGPTVKQITDDNNQKMAKIVAAIKALGVDAKDIATTEYNLYPNYNTPVYYPNSPDQNQVPKITGYTLNQTVMVKVRNLDNSDKVLDAALTSGANQIGSLTFDVDDPSQLKGQAQDKAFAAAKDKADAMAKAVGVKIGRVITFSEGDAGSPVPMVNFTMSKGMTSGEAVSADASAVEPGSKEYDVSVSVTYEID